MDLSVVVVMISNSPSGSRIRYLLEAPASCMCGLRRIRTPYSTTNIWQDIVISALSSSGPEATQLVVDCGDVDAISITPPRDFSRWRVGLILPCSNKDARVLLRDRYEGSAS